MPIYWSGSDCWKLSQDKNYNIRLVCRKKLKLYLKFLYRIDYWNNGERERNGVGQGDGNKSILLKNLWQNPKAAGRLQEPVGKSARLETVSKETGYPCFLYTLFRVKKITKTNKQILHTFLTEKLDHDKKYLLLSSVFPVTETTCKPSKPASA